MSLISSAVPIVLAALLAAEAQAQTDTEDKESVVPGDLNFRDFVPLEVGNRWTFSHEYYNELYWVSTMGWDLKTRAYFSRFEVPGYPIDGEDRPPEYQMYPAPVTLTVEITHTEWINGEEYFVFSKPSYSWPPLPMFFLAGQRVRWSKEEGILYLSISLPGVEPPLFTDVPLYEFGMLSSEYDYAVNHNEQSNSSLSWPWSERIEVHRSMLKWLSNPKFPEHRFYFPFFSAFPDHLDITVNPFFRERILEILFTLDHNPESPWDYHLFEASFVHGYGLATFQLGQWGPPYWERFLNILYPVSAVLSGKEVSYEEATEKLVTLVEPDPIPAVGQIDSIWMGFDFSEEAHFDTHSEYPPRTADIELSQVWDSHADYGNPPVLVSYYGMADLGRVDFARLVSDKPTDLEPDPHDTVRGDEGFIWTTTPQENHVYAFWTREGGLVLAHLIEIVEMQWYGAVVALVFDWKYVPPPLTLPPRSGLPPGES